MAGIQDQDILLHLNMNTLPYPSRGVRAPHVILGLLIVVHLAVVVSILTQDRPVIWPLHNDTIHRTGPAGDFYSVYNAAVNLRRGIDPYSGSPDGITPYKYPFRYLPVVAAVFQPFTWLPPKVSWITWILVLEALTATLVVTIWRWMKPRKRRLVTIGALLLSSPYFLELYMGQFTFAAVALLGLTLWYPARNPAYGVSTILKPFTLAALPALGVQRRYWWHALWSFAFVLATSVPYFMAFPEQWTTFYTANFTATSSFDAGNFAMLKFISWIWDDLGVQPFGLAWTTWVSGLRYLVLGGTAVLVIHSRCHSAVPGVVALILAHFLTFPDVWEHHLSAVCVLCTLLIVDRDRNHHSTLPLLGLLVLLAIPTPSVLFDAEKDPSIWDPSASWPRSMRYALVLSKALPCALLYGAAAWQLGASGFNSPKSVLRRLLGGGD